MGQKFLFLIGILCYFSSFFITISAARQEQWIIFVFTFLLPWFWPLVILNLGIWILLAAKLFNSSAPVVAACRSFTILGFWANLCFSACVMWQFEFFSFEEYFSPKAFFLWTLGMVLILLTVDVGKETEDLDDEYLTVGPCRWGLLLSGGALIIASFKLPFSKFSIFSTGVYLNEVFEFWVAVLFPFQLSSATFFIANGLVLAMIASIVFNKFKNQLKPFALGVICMALIHLFVIHLGIGDFEALESKWISGNFNTLLRGTTYWFVGVAAVAISGFLAGLEKEN